MSASSRKSPRDATGRAAVELAELHAEEIAANASRISTMTPPTVVDYGDDELELSDTVEVSAATKRLRVNTDLENITIGQGTDYTFLRGQTYTVPINVWNRLEEIGFVYH
ncbi:MULTISPECIES: hypothetical protein [Streptosporangium]|uniref:Uncharacterized protein n=1 Tax=Streptosporangium brasiliense TaxID=47480 RepID=A0ABT9RM12_9ACTN|nr:hypothetical protein [Streptosporangium brasiliense]MDP9870331.1 hypothetical protein [Streptosporangium brasiliense]